MQKRPLIHFNAFTEMTEAGRARRAATPQEPVFYSSYTGKFDQQGIEVPAGERPPPVAELEAAIKGALAANGFLPAPSSELRPEILIMLHYGSHNNGIPSPSSPEELLPLIRGDRLLYRDLLQRATLLAGEKFARDLKFAIDTAPPFFMPGESSSSREHVTNVVFHPCYFVIASAYDVDRLERGEKVLLWRTRMSVEAQGVSTEEIFVPLIENAGQYLGRELKEPLMIKKRILREGNIRIGTPTVVEEVRTSPLPPSTGAP